MSKLSISLSVLFMLAAVSCTSGPEFVPDRYGDDDDAEENNGMDADPDTDSEEDKTPDDSPNCTFDCLSESACVDQGGTEHIELTCTGEDICCELDKGLDPPDETECSYDCMASWLCNFRGTPHPEMTCQGNNVCCEVGGSGPGGGEPDPTPDPTCEFDCVNSFMCNFIGEEHPEMTCAGNNVCCERGGSDGPGDPGDNDPNDGQCEFECVSFFECRSDSAIRHDEMSCNGWSEVCCEFDADPNPDPGDENAECTYDCVRRNRCAPRGGQEIPNMSCEDNRVCCRF